MADPAEPPDPWSEPTLAGSMPAAKPDDKTVVVPREERSPGAAATGTFAAGELLAERFRIVRFLGHGGMGEVYEAEDTDLGVRVALKTIRLEIARQPGILERFKREINLARKISHDNVCKVFDISHHGAVTFLTMELLAGETLEQRLRRTGPLREEEALPIARQMAAGLAAAHRAGIVHRDFKPANVMLVPEPVGVRPVVMDFGLAHGTEPALGAGLTQLGDFLGTPSYMAPEQVAGEKVTAATDVYAFGITLYEMMTGTLPFVGDTASSVAFKRLREEPPSPRLKSPELDPHWEEAILRCLARDPANRSADIRAAAAALEGGAGLPIPVRSRRRSWIYVPIALALLLITAAFWWSWHRPRAQAKQLLDDGMNLLYDGEYAKALDDFERARQAFVLLGDRDRAFEAVGRIGLAVGYQGRLEQGEQLVNRALSHFERQENRAAQAKQLIGLGALYQNIPDLDKARGYFARGRIEAEGAHDPRLQASASLALGTVLYQQNDLPEADAQLRSALQTQTRLGDEQGVLTQLTLGEVLLDRGQLPEALSFAERAQQSCRDAADRACEAEAGALLARIRLAQRDIRAARGEIDSIKRLDETSSDPWIHGVVALAAAKVLGFDQKTDAAIRWLERAHQEVRQSRNAPLELELRLALGEIESDQRDRERGRDLLLQVKADAERYGMRLIANKAAGALVR